MAGTKQRKPKKAKKVTLAAGANGDIKLATVQVSDPFEPHKQLSVTKNIKVHPLDTMLERGLLKDPRSSKREDSPSSASRYEAGQRFLQIFERSQIGSVQAIDYERVKVDVSYVHRGLEDSVIAATAELTSIRSYIGSRPYSLLRTLIGERRSAHALAVEAPGGAMERQIWYINQCIRDALDDLIECFGVARGPDWARIRAQFINKADLTGVGTGAMK